MLRRFCREHQYKLLIGAPIVFLLLISNIGVSLPANNFTLTSDAKPFLTSGSAFHMTVSANTLAQVNAVGGTITYPPDLIAVTGVETTGSIVDLWSEEPAFSNATGMVHFSGGLLDETENLRNAPVLTIDFRVLKPGKANIALVDGMLLASDGDGTNLLTNGRAYTVWIRDPGAPSPDINNDGELSIGDVNALYLHTFRAYDRRFDQNGDGKVNWADVKYLSELAK